MQMPADEQLHAGAEDDDGEHDRERRGYDNTRAQRPRSHLPSTKPTPRTVSISCGSPSFLRR